MSAVTAFADSVHYVFYADIELVAGVVFKKKCKIGLFYVRQDFFFAEDVRNIAVDFFQKVFALVESVGGAEVAVFFQTELNYCVFAAVFVDFFAGLLHKIFFVVAASDYIGSYKLVEATALVYKGDDFFNFVNAV